MDYILTNIQILFPHFLQGYSTKNVSFISVACIQKIYHTGGGIILYVGCCWLPISLCPSFMDFRGIPDQSSPYTNTASYIISNLGQCSYNFQVFMLTKSKSFRLIFSLMNVLYKFSLDKIQTLALQLLNLIYFGQDPLD